MYIAPFAYQQKWTPPPPQCTDIATYIHILPLGAEGGQPSILDTKSKGYKKLSNLKNKKK